MSVTFKHSTSSQRNLPVKVALRKGRQLSVIFSKGDAEALGVLEGRWLGGETMAGVFDIRRAPELPPDFKGRVRGGTFGFVAKEGGYLMQVIIEHALSPFFRSIPIPFSACILMGDGALRLDTRASPKQPVTVRTRIPQPEPAPEHEPAPEPAPTPVPEPVASIAAAPAPKSMPLPGPGYDMLQTSCLDETKISAALDVLNAATRLGKGGAVANAIGIVHYNFNLSGTKRLNGNLVETS